MTTSYLVSPLVFVWSTSLATSQAASSELIPPRAGVIGYGSAADQRKLLGSIQRQSVLITSTCAPTAPTRKNVAVLDLSRDELHLLADAQLDCPPDEPHLPSPTSSSEHPSESSTSSSATTASPPRSPTAAAEFALDDAAYEAALADRSLHARPLSTILSHFSHRVTAHLSSFELVDQLSFDAAEEELFPHQHHLREPTKAEEQFVARAMEVEVQAVEQILQHVIEQSRAAPVVEVEVEEGQSYFDSMRPVSGPPPFGLGAGRS